MLALLRTLYARRREVAIEPVAIGDAEGELELHLNLPNPTVATGPPAFIASAEGAPGWEGQRWSARTACRSPPSMRSSRGTASRRS